MTAIPNTPEKTLSPTQAADYLGLTPNTIRAYCLSGALAAEKKHRRWIIKWSDFRNFIHTPRRVGNPGYAKR